MGAAIEKGAGHDLKRGIEDKWNGDLSRGPSGGARWLVTISETTLERLVRGARISAQLANRASAPSPGARSLRDRVRGSLGRLHIG